MAALANLQDNYKQAYQQQMKRSEVPASELEKILERIDKITSGQLKQSTSGRLRRVDSTGSVGSNHSNLSHYSHNSAKK